MRKGFFVTLALIMVLALFGSATVALGAAPQPMAVPTHAIDVAVGATTDGYQVLLQQYCLECRLPAGVSGGRLRYSILEQVG